MPTECQAEEDAAQQRVVDIPAADLGITVQDVEEGRGRTGEPAQVDHALARGERPVEEPHAVDVDELESPLSLLGAVSAEDVPLIEVAVVDPLLVEFRDEAGEGVENRPARGVGEAGCELRQRFEVGVAGDVETVCQTPLSAVFTPGNRLRRPDAEADEPYGVFEGAPSLAAADVCIEYSLQGSGLSESFGSQQFALLGEQSDRIAPGVQHRPFAPLEQGGEFFYEFVQPFVARIKMQTHGGLFVSGAKLRRNTSRALFNKAL